MIGAQAHAVAVSHVGRVDGHQHSWGHNIHHGLHGHGWGHGHGNHAWGHGALGWGGAQGWGLHGAWGAPAWGGHGHLGVGHGENWGHVSFSRLVFFYNYFLLDIYYGYLTYSIIMVIIMVRFLTTF